MSESVAFTEEVTKELALEGWRTGLELAKEKGAAPIMEEEFTVTPTMKCVRRPEMANDGYQGRRQGTRQDSATCRYSRYMQQVAEEAPELIEELSRHGCRFTHHSSIAPTGTISACHWPITPVTALSPASPITTPAM